MEQIWCKRFNWEREEEWRRHGGEIKADKQADRQTESREKDQRERGMGEGRETGGQGNKAEGRDGGLGWLGAFLGPTPTWWWQVMM